MRLVPVSPNRWRLHYHAEQTRDPANRISLSNETDTLGLPRLRIDFRMQERDFEGVLVAHEVLDADLRDAQAGALHWDGDRLECLASVRAAAADGYHQLGGACMSTR